MAYDPEVYIANIRDVLNSMKPAVTRQGEAYTGYKGCTDQSGCLSNGLMDALEPGRTSFPADIARIEGYLDELDKALEDDEDSAPGSPRPR